MRVVCVKDGVVVNVIEVEDLDKVPEVVGVDEGGRVIRRDEVQLVVSQVGSVGDLFIEGRGFFRCVGV